MTQLSMHHLSAYFQSRPVAIERTRLPELLEFARAQAARVARMAPDAIDAAVRAAAETPLGRMVGAVAVIPIRGCITQKADFYSWYFGGTSVERLVASFRQYASDPQVSAIVFDVDSPGGEVYGLQEGFKELYAGRSLKKTYAVVNPFMASAAYFLGSAAENIWMTESGQVGSIGCYTMHVDLSKMLEEFGVTVTLIQHGQHKTDGNPYQPLSDEAREDLQSTVNFYGGEFDKAVALARDVTVADVQAKFGQGKMFRAPDAKRVGFIDQIGTRDELLAKLAPSRSRMSLTAAVADAGQGEAPRLTLAASAIASEKSDTAETVEPDENGECPEGYERGEDGRCHLANTEEAAASDAAQLDADAVAVALALSEL